MTGRRNGKTLQVAERICEMINNHETCAVLSVEGKKEVVPVTRCKECKHRPKEPEGGADHGSDYIFPDDVCPCQCEGDPWYSWMPPDNWFCPKGELKGRGAVIIDIKGGDNT